MMCSRGFLKKISPKNIIRYNPILRTFVTIFMVDTDFPAVIGIDPTNACNLHCSFCGASKVKGDIGTMEFSLFRRIIDESLANGKRWMILLHNAGEPLLSKDICQMARFIKEKNAAWNVQFATNGTLLTEELARCLIMSGLDQITFSVDAYSRDEYKALKGEDSLQKVIDNAAMLMRLKAEMRKKTPLVSAKMVKRKGFEHTFEPFLRMWSSVADEALLTPYSNWGGAVDYEGVENIPQKRFACHFLWYYPVVNWDGKVFFCCASCDEEAVIGDLRKNTLKEIWQGGTLKGIRKAHLAGKFSDIPVCDKCTYWAESKVSLDWWLKRK